MEAVAQVKAFANPIISNCINHCLPQSGDLSRPGALVGVLPKDPGMTAGDHGLLHVGAVCIQLTDLELLTALTN